MSYVNTSFQTFSSSGQGDETPSSQGTVMQDGPTASTRASLNQIFSPIYTKNKKRKREADNLRELLATLRRLQPLDITELTGELCISHTTIQKRLNRLVDLDLVVCTRFEHHCLYCINGLYNSFVEEILSDPMG